MVAKADQVLGLKSNTKSTAQRTPPLQSHRNTDETSSAIWPRWKAFTTIIVSLVFGIIFALGHHCMNSYLNGKQVTDVPISQSWISRFGTAFAFLVKTAFVISVGASYVQYQWFKFHRQSFRVDEIDSLTDVLENAMCFVYNLVFVHQPVLLLIAMVTW